MKFVKKVDYHKVPKGACLMSEYDLGYKGFLGIRWGWLITRWNWFWLEMEIKHLWIWKLKWGLHKIRYKIYKVNGCELVEFDRLTFRKKKIGVFIDGR